jgi:hypothetical protein
VFLLGFRDDDGRSRQSTRDKSRICRLEPELEQSYRVCDLVACAIVERTGYRARP